MQVKLRLQRFGTKKRPYYRIVAATSTKKRDGLFLEIVGLYHPIEKKENQYRLNNERITHWLNNGATPSETVKDILKTNGLWKPFALDAEAKRVARVKKRNQKKKVAKKKQTSAATQEN